MLNLDACNSPEAEQDYQDRLRPGDIKATSAALIDALREEAAEVAKLNPSFDREQSFRWALDGIAEQYLLDNATQRWLLDAAAGARMTTKPQQYIAGRDAWRHALASYLDNASEIEFPRENPYGDEYDNPPAQAFRRGFDAAAREDGYTYSRVSGEYCEGGDGEIDDFPEPSDIEELN